MSGGESADAAAAPQATILLAGMLPDPQTAVDIMGIAHVLASGLFNVPMGLSGAVSCTCMCSVRVMLKGTHYGK